MAIEETYPAFRSKILRAREEGFSDDEINTEIRGKIQSAAKEGFTPEEINRELGEIKRPSFAQVAKENIGGAVKSGAKAVVDVARSGAQTALGAAQRFVRPIGEEVREFAKAPAAAPRGPRIYSPETGAAVTRAIERVIPNIPKTVESLFAGYPEEERRTQETLRPVFGRFAEPAGRTLTAGRTILGLPFTAAPPVVTETLGQAMEGTKEISERGARAVGLPEDISKVVGELSPDLLMVFGPLAFRKLYNRAPKGNQEILDAAKTDPAFVQEVKGTRPPTREPVRPKEEPRPPVLETKPPIEQPRPQEPVRTAEPPTIRPPAREEAGPPVERPSLPYESIATDPSGRRIATGLSPEHTKELFGLENILRERGENIAALRNSAMEALPDTLRGVERQQSFDQVYLEGLRKLAGKEYGGRGEPVPKPAVEQPLAGELPPPEAKLKRVRPTRVKPEEELALSEFVKREGGIRITADIPGELRALTKENKRAATLLRKDPTKGMTTEEMAELAFDRGYITEPTTNALLGALREDLRGNKILSREKAARVDEAKLQQQDIERQAETKIQDLTRERGPMEFEGHRFESAERVPGGVRLKDDVDMTLKKADDILSVERKAESKPPTGGEQFKTTGGEIIPAGQFPSQFRYGGLGADATKARARDANGALWEQTGWSKGGYTIIKKIEEAPKTKPIFEQTQAGQQGVIPGAEGRTIPQGGIRPKARQQETLTDLERGSMREEPELFGKREAKASEEVPFDIPEAGPEFEPGSSGFPAGKRGTSGAPESGFPKSTSGDVPFREGQPTDNPFKTGFLKRILGRRGGEKLIGRAQIVRDMQDALDVPIRTGRGNFAQMKAVGFFKIREEVIRLKFANDIDVTAHEVGHFLSKKVLGYRYSGKKAGGRAFDNELVKLGRDLYGSRKPNHGYAEEGIAEFVRMYITKPDEAKQKAPNFFKEFERVVNEDFTDVRNVLLKARKDIRRFNDLPATQRILSEISIGEKGRQHSFSFSDLYTAFLDDLNPIRKFTDAMRQGKELPVDQDPYAMSRLLKGIGGKIGVFLEDHTFDFHGLKPNGKGLRAIMEPVSRNLDDFRVYLTARRTLELMNRGKESGIRRGDAEAAIRELEPRYPHFTKAAEEIYAYNDRLLAYLKDSGILDKQSFERIRELNKEYVPFFRIFEDAAGGPAVGTRKIADLGQGVKRIKGSGRELVDPLESIIKNTYALMSLADRNGVMRAIVNLAGKTEGAGKYVERIPTPKVPVTLRDIELKGIIRKYSRMKETTEFKTRKQEFTKEIGAEGQTTETTGTKGQQLIEARVKEALINRGFTEGESKLYIERLKSAKTDTAVNSIIERIIQEEKIIQVTRELELDLPPSITEIFRPMATAPKGENIVTHWVNGKKVFYQLEPELYRAVTAVDRQGATWLNALLNSPKTHERVLGHVLTGPARGLRIGATTLSTEFPLRNPVRDQMTAWLQTRYGYKPATNFIEGLFHVAKQYTRGGDDLYTAWLKAGGDQAAMVAIDRVGMQKSLEQIVSAKTTKGIGEYIIWHPIDSARVISALGEEATRLGEFSQALKRRGAAPKTATKAEITEAALASREVTLDFNRAGAKMRAFSQMTAFLNPKIQGIDKMFREIKAHPTRVLTKAAVGITLPSIYLYLANRDDPRYQELPRWQKSIFWIIPTGDMDNARWSKMSPAEKAQFSQSHPVWRIPKPFEPGLIFGTLPELALEWIDKEDPAVLEEMKKAFTPEFYSAIPTIALPLIENMMNYSFFKKRPLVSRAMEKREPAEQFTPFTSETAKAIGKATGTSPAKIENLVQGWGGGFGKNVLSGADKVLAGLRGDTRPEEPEKGLADTMGIRAFVARFPDAGAESIEQFYNRLEKAEVAYNTFGAMRKQQRFEEAEEYREQHQAEIREFSRLRDYGERLTDTRKRMERIRQSKDMDGAEKRRELDKLSFQMITFARRALGKERESRTLEDIGLEPAPRSRLLEDLGLR